MRINTCPWCEQPFTPRRGRPNQPTCGKEPCRGLQIGASRRGKPIQKIRDTLRQKANHRIRERLRAQFGELSIREIEVFRFAWKTATKRGYDRARWQMGIKRDRPNDRLATKERAA